VSLDRFFPEMAEWIQDIADEIVLELTPVLHPPEARERTQQELGGMDLQQFLQASMGAGHRDDETHPCPFCEDVLAAQNRGR
jgi:hypothetical protein